MKSQNVLTLLLLLAAKKQRLTKANTLREDLKVRNNETKTTRANVLTLNRFQKLQRQALQLVCKLNPGLGVRIALYQFMKPRKRSPYGLELLPTEVKTQKLKYGDGDLVTHSWGMSEKIIYLIHGWESHSARMSSLVEPLLNLGFRVIAIDMPGHGYSTKQATHLGDFAAAFTHVINHLGEPYGVIAHSFGATATVFLLKQKRHLRPQKLCLLAPMLSLKNHLDIFNSIAGLSPKMINNLMLELESRHSLTIENTNLASHVKELDFSGLIIHDQDDSLIPFADGEAIACAWPQARFVVTQALGHRNLLRSEQVISEVSLYMAS